MSDYLNWYPGQRVVCVDGVPAPHHNKGEIYPATGAVYTMRDATYRNGIVGIRLREIINEPRNYREGFNECRFVSRRFRPLEPKAMQLFRQIAAGTKPVHAEMAE